MAESRFYGTVRGHDDTVASRTGNTQSGLCSTTFTKSADLIVSVDDRDGEDWILISVRLHNSTSVPNVLYYGPIKELLDANHLLVQIAQAAFKNEFARDNPDEGENNGA